MPEANDIFADTDWLPHAYDPAADRVQFLRIPQEARKELTFLADYKPQSAADAVWVAGDKVRAAAVTGPAPSYIFHSAFCRSTLLVKALDALDGARGLSEPMIFNSLQASPPTPQARSLIAPLMRLLGRRDGEEVVIAKPSNFANGLIPLLLQDDTSSKAICIHGSCEEFLRSVAKKGLEGRIWARKQLAHNRRIVPLDLGLNDNAFYELTDMQAAALMWLFHVRQFHGLTQTFPDRVLTLLSSRFVEDKEATFAAAAGFYGFEAGTEEIADVAQGPLFSKHAKQGGDYEEVVRAQEEQGRSAVVDEEIAKVGEWISLIARQLQMPVPLPSPLV